MASTTATAKEETEKQSLLCVSGMENFVRNAVDSYKMTISKSVNRVKVADCGMGVAVEDGVFVLSSTDDRNEVEAMIKRDFADHSADVRDDSTQGGDIVETFHAPEKKSLLQRFKDAESKVLSCDVTDFPSEQNVHSRLERIQHAIGFADSEFSTSNVIIVKMTLIEQEIEDLTQRTNAVQDQVYDRMRASRTSAPLPNRLSALEDTLGLAHTDDNLLVRVSCLEKEFALRISKIEEKVFEELHATTHKLSLDDRLSDIEEGMGSECNSDVLFQRIRTVEESIDSTKFRIVKLEERVYGQVYSGKTEESLPFRLTSLESELSLKSKKYSVADRISRIEETFVHRVSGLEEQVYEKVHPETTEQSLTKRVQNLGKELGLEKNGDVLFSNIQSFEKGVNYMKFRLDELEKRVYAPIPEKSAEDKFTTWFKLQEAKQITSEVNEPVSIRVWSLEKELGLEQEGYSLSERINIIEKSFGSRISILENFVYESGHPTQNDEPLSDRLNNLENELGIPKGGSTLFARILPLRDAIGELKMEISQLELRVFDELRTSKTKGSLHDRLSVLEKELGLERSSRTAISRLPTVAKGIRSTARKIHEIEVQVYQKGFMSYEDKSSFDRLMMLENALGLEPTKNNQGTTISFLHKHMSSMKLAISKLEEQLHEEDFDNTKVSILDRLGNLEKDLGLDKNSANALVRIGALEGMLL